MSDHALPLLLVEDHTVKELQLNSAISTAFPDLEVVVARSYQSAVIALEAASFAVVVLDMTIPTFDRAPGEAGGRPRAYGGRDLLDAIEASAHPTPAIVVSQYRRFEESAESKNLGELEEELRVQFPRSFRGAVYFDSTRTDWQHKLIKRLTRALDR